MHAAETASSVQYILHEISRGGSRSVDPENSASNFANQFTVYLDHIVYLNDMNKCWDLLEGAP